MKLKDPRQNHGAALLMIDDLNREVQTLKQQYDRCESALKRIEKLDPQHGQAQEIARKALRED